MIGRTCSPSVWCPDPDPRYSVSNLVPSPPPHPDRGSLYSVGTLIGTPRYPSNVITSLTCPLTFTIPTPTAPSTRRDRDPPYVRKPNPFHFCPGSTGLYYPGSESRRLSRSLVSQFRSVQGSLSPVPSGVDEGTCLTLSLYRNRNPLSEKCVMDRRSTISFVDLDSSHCLPVLVPQDGGS